MAKQVPLVVRIYFQPHLTELVRLIGYDICTLDEARTRLAPLVDKYGREKINRAAREVLAMDATTARLNPVVRTAAYQLLGPPPAGRPSEAI